MDGNATWDVRSHSDLHTNNDFEAKQFFQAWIVVRFRTVLLRNQNVSCVVEIAVFRCDLLLGLFCVMNYVAEHFSHNPTDPAALVCVIDADVLVRTRCKELFEYVSLRVLLFESPAAFLQSSVVASASCVVLDVRLPGMSGIKLQEELSKREIQVPLVFVSGSADAVTVVRAMKAGAADFLTKPVADREILDAVFVSIECDRERRRKEASLATLRAQFSSLTARERQVLVSVAAGKLNKQVAADLGISEVMVKVHRAHGIRKMQIASLAELIRAIDRLTDNRETGRSSIQDGNLQRYATRVA